MGLKEIIEKIVYEVTVAKKTDHKKELICYEIFEEGDIWTKRTAAHEHYFSQILNFRDTPDVMIKVSYSLDHPVLGYTSKVILADNGNTVRCNIKDEMILLEPDPELLTLDDIIDDFKNEYLRIGIKLTKYRTTHFFSKKDVRFDQDVIDHVPCICNVVG